MPKNGNGKSELVVGVDIGGTKLHAVIADRSGKILGRARKKTRAERGFKEVMCRVNECIEEACADAKVERRYLLAAGIGAPSAIREDGTAVNATNLGWRNEPLVKTLEKILAMPVFADNDCNVGTLGEFVYGAARGAETAVGLFVGTGLGGGLVFHGRLWRGKHRLATEFGHMIVQVDGRKCGCGHNGCLEAYVSKVGMSKRFAEEILIHGRRSWLAEKIENNDYSGLRSSMLAEAFHKGDEVACEILRESARYLGIGVGNIINVIGPEVVIIGGGVYEALGKDLIGVVREAARTSAFPAEIMQETRIELSKLGDDAVALGAAAYAWQSRSAKKEM